MFINNKTSVFNMNEVKLLIRCLIKSFAIFEKLCDFGAHSIVCVVETVAYGLFYGCQTIFFVINLVISIKR